MSHSRSTDGTGQFTDGPGQSSAPTPAVPACPRLGPSAGLRRRTLTGIFALGVALFVGLVALGVYALTTHGGDGEARMRLVEGEFEKVRPPAGAVRAGSSVSRKAGLPLIEMNYLCDCSAAELTTHYTGQLERDGWRYEGARPVLDWGRDQGVREMTWRKGEFKASVFYSRPQRQAYGADYSFSIGRGR